MTTAEQQNKRKMPLWPLHKSPYVNTIGLLGFSLGMVLIFVPGVLANHTEVWTTRLSIIIFGLLALGFALSCGVLWLGKRHNAYLATPVPGTMESFSAFADRTVYVIPTEGTVEDLQRLLTTYRKETHIAYQVVITSDYHPKNKHTLRVDLDRFRYLYERRDQHFDPSMLEAPMNIGDTEH